jgi:di/tripeptidase
LIEQNKIAFSKIANVNIHDIYPGWAEDINSDLIKVVKDSYEGVLKKEVKIS